MVIKVKYNGEWVKIPYLSSDHGQELVEEAPKDGSQYARQNGIWSVVNIPEVDFTEVYNNMKAEQERDLAEAAAYAISHMDEKTENNHTTKTSLWQKIKNLFKRRK